MGEEVKEPIILKMILESHNNKDHHEGSYVKLKLDSFGITKTTKGTCTEINDEDDSVPGKTTEVEYDSWFFIKKEHVLSLEVGYRYVAGCYELGIHSHYDWLSITFKDREKAWEWKNIIFQWMNS